MEFAEILRAVREDKGLSQSDLAAKTGLQPSAISHFEAGRRSPSFDNLRRLADALNVPIDYLLGRSTQREAAGPASDLLFRNFEKLSSEDQAQVNQFAEFLAEKGKPGKEQ
jgi:transcriptional regulator with XRE-family HTH domain